MQSLLRCLIVTCLFIPTTLQGGQPGEKQAEPKVEPTPLLPVESEPKTALPRPRLPDLENGPYASYDPQIKLSPEQNKISVEITRLGGSINHHRRLLNWEEARGNPNKEKWEITCSVWIDARQNRDKMLGNILPRLKQLENLTRLEIESLEFTEDTLALLGKHLRDVKSLRNVSLGYRTIPAKAEVRLRSLLPQLPEDRVQRNDNPAFLIPVEKHVQLNKLYPFHEALPRPVDPTASAIRQLEIERYNLTIEAYQLAITLHKAGVPGSHAGSFNILGRRVLAAALPLCETPEERVIWWERAVESAELATKREEAGLKIGEVTNLDLNFAKMQVIETKLELLRAREAAQKKSP